MTQHSSQKNRDLLCSRFNEADCCLGIAGGERAYIPNVEVPSDSGPARVSDPAGRVPGLALVASRPLQDEELLLNYRLSNHVSRPLWYTPVDEEEDKRRWA